MDVHGEETRLLQGDNKEIEGKDLRPSNPEFEKLENEEQTLATSLRSICTSSGEEVRKTLRESADNLLKLGQVYLQRAVLEAGIEKKMTYIHCTVLLHAAIERFKITDDPEKIQQAMLICNKMSDSLLKSCGSRIQVPLLEISEKLFELVCKKRIEIQGILDTDLCRSGESDPDFSAKMNVPEKLKIIENMENISTADLEHILSPDRLEKERKITEKVQDMNENVTAFYKRIMQDITSECLKLMPYPPCKFAVVGLGSLAREEVTLYSDFEHIILLEKGIDDKENYESIVEYFRWFSVVFQVIVIGFGEAIIPSVAVKSLNDSYSGKAELNWFYDNYTPNGISFDGMLPHACKIPIGRQQPTKNRPDTVELIKTPQKMAEYLTQKEQLKNGYHLADVLRQTCLVYGDRGIYDMFVEERARILDEDETAVYEIYEEMILKNTTPDVRTRNTLHTFERSFDSKPVFYRPFATFIAVIGRILKLEAKSTFAVIDKLVENEMLGDYAYNKLKYAFAIACEIRMKLYHKVNRQTHQVRLLEMRKTMGKEAMRTCRNTLSELKAATESVVETGDFGSLKLIDDILTKSDRPHAITDLAECGYREEAIKLGEKLCQVKRGKLRTAQFDIAMLLCYYKAVLAGSRNSVQCMTKAEALYFKLQEQELGLETNVDEEMAAIYFCMNEYRKFLTPCENFFGKYFRAKQKQKGYEHAFFIEACYLYHTAMKKSGLNWEQGVERLKTVLWDRSDNIECQLLKRWHLAKRSFDEGNTGQNIQKEFCSISADVQKSIKKLIKPANFHLWLIDVQIRMWWLEDAVETLKSASQYQRTVPSCDTRRENDIHFIESWKLLCLCRSHGDKIARQVVSKDQQTPVNDKQRNEVLFQRLVKIVWRGVNLSRRTVGSISVLTWLMHLQKQGRIRSVFCAHRWMNDPKERFAKLIKFVEEYTEKYSQRAYIIAEELLIAMLLLAKFL